MKILLKISAMVIIVSLMFSVLYPYFVSAKTSSRYEKFTATNNDDNIANHKRDIIKDFLFENVEIHKEDRFVEQDGEEIYRLSKQEYDIDLFPDTLDKDLSTIDKIFDVKYTAANESGSSKKSKTDNSISVKITLTVKYSISNNKIKMSKVISKLVACNGSTTSNVGSGVFIDSNELTYGQVDPGHLAQKKTVPLPKKACKKTYDTSKWSAVAVSASIVGATQIVSLHRGNSHWSVTLTNNVSDTMPGMGDII